LSKIQDGYIVKYVWTLDSMVNHFESIWVLSLLASLDRA